MIVNEEALGYGNADHGTVRAAERAFGRRHVRSFVRALGYKLRRRQKVPWTQGLPMKALLFDRDRANRRRFHGRRLAGPSKRRDELRTQHFRLL